jgi:uncharacterized integral membrane protein (TIGR00697 family)
MVKYKYYDLLLAAFIAALLCSNLIGAGKVAVINLPYWGMVSYGAGILFFPITYLFGDIFTEVYGYKYDRRAVWAGFFALMFAALMSLVVLSLKPDSSPYMSNYQSGLETVFGNTWRIILASLIAFACGSFVNSYVLAKMKLLTHGRYLWARTIGSTLLGELVDSSIFYMTAFYGIWSAEQIISVTVAQYLLKSGWEVAMTPVTYKIVAWLKKREQEDYYDWKTNFTPFSIRL